MQLTKCPECSASWRVRGVEPEASVTCPFCSHIFPFKLLAGTTVRIGKQEIETALETTEIIQQDSTSYLSGAIPSGLKIRLEMLNPSHGGKVWELQKGRTIIGRGESDIEFNDGKTSRKHFALEVHGEDKIIVIDLASTNGTFINDLRVAQARVHDGDIIRAGSNEMKIHIEKQ